MELASLRLTEITTNTQLYTAHQITGDHFGVKTAGVLTLSEWQVAPKSEKEYIGTPSLELRARSTPYSSKPGQSTAKKDLALVALAVYQATLSCHQTLRVEEGHVLASVISRSVPNAMPPIQ